MPTNVNEFSYILPDEQIAQIPVEPRDHSRLLVLDRETGAMKHLEHFYQILDELVAGDVLVFNVSKVFCARLMLDGFEVFVLKVRDDEIDALVKPGRKAKIGLRIGEFEVIAKSDDGIFTLKTSMNAAEMFSWCAANGSVPTPPYITTELVDADRYQTVYAKATGSVAAPTAGLHFTQELIDRARSKGIQIEEVTLHVGIGTFRPVQTENIEDHVMHAEYVELDAGTAERICAAKSEGRRIIAVGTTTVRTLEGIAATAGELQAFSGDLNIFITPGFQFQVIDGMITNFHLPKSTLLMLVSAFAGRERVLAAYEEAIHLSYRFFSFGDVMFIR
ncbi:MAG: tRNA preQ1(34) S-adenosylmethionine ribosyltransferase-isomerase QueA [Patescibacteria group bacterium]|jgi:S-adenosylmethionine:tRNA ribosyltransferase-isomerase